MVQSENFTNSKRIAKNTLMLYFRQILVMIVSLYTVRVLLKALGVIDYGIYNVVAGMVTMFSFVSSSMAAASQRFFSYDLGKKNFAHLKCIFSQTVLVYLCFSVVFLIVAEAIGIPFIKYKLVLPDERKIAAYWVFEFAIVAFVFTMMTTPYMSVITAHEYMNIYAVVSLIEVTLKLIIVFLVQFFCFDKLICYSILLTIVTIINTTIYRCICKKKFSECRFKFYFNRVEVKEMIDYVGWNFFGNLANVARNQGVNILLNLFFGPVVNAARSVASQIYTALISFTTNFSNALRPQIIKSYAAQNKSYMLDLMFAGTRFVFYLMLVICLPLYFKADFILNLWLKNPPQHTLVFMRLVIIEVLIECISHPLMSVSQATGKIRLYQSAVGITLVLNLPVSYYFLKLGYEPEVVYIIGISFAAIATVLRILIVQNLIGENLVKRFIQILFRFMLVLIASFFVPYIFDRLNILSGNTFIACLIFFVGSCFWTLFCSFFIGLTCKEQKFCITKFKERL